MYVESVRENSYTSTILLLYAFLQSSSNHYLYIHLVVTWYPDFQMISDSPPTTLVIALSSWKKKCGDEWMNVVRSVFLLKLESFAQNSRERSACCPGSCNLLSVCIYIYRYIDISFKFLFFCSCIFFHIIKYMWSIKF